MYMEHLGSAEVNVASPGFGAVANSVMDFINADELYPTYSIPNGLHRRSDPGAGAFTYYHNRHTRASREVQQGEEIFVSYGSQWFLGRKDKLGAIPVAGDHDKADRLYRRFRDAFVEQKDAKRKRDQEIRQRLMQEGISGDSMKASLRPDPSPANPKLFELAPEIWETFVLKSAWGDSPTMAALPPEEDYDEMYEQTLTQLKKSRMMRSPEYLEESGVCADHLHFGESTIRQAGHGAFATRHLRKGDIVVPVPLIHIPDRELLDMYHFRAEPFQRIRGDPNLPRRPQLLLNYCLGHRDSTLLLSPYGPLFNLINHNQTMANVRLQWASPKRSQHDPEMLQKNITEFDNLRQAVLAMEVVALRDIEPNEEIFLDYGDEWEAAWQKHVREWKPVEGADTYVSAFEMNNRFGHVYRTEFEQVRNPYPTNLMLKLHKAFLNSHVSRTWLKSHPEAVREVSTRFNPERSVECEILRYTMSEKRILYTVVVPKHGPVQKNIRKKEWQIVQVPQEAIFFQDRPYTSDMFLENAFRHDIRISDELFPEEWKNLKLNQTKMNKPNEISEQGNETTS